MLKYKLLRLEAWEIDEFNNFINRMALQGWHPVQSWTRFLSLLKFEYDPIKKGEYAVVYNQYNVGAQFEPVEDKSNLQSDIDFKNHLNDLDFELVTPFAYFDILYLNDKTFEDQLVINDVIKKRVGKKRFLNNMIVSVLWALVILLNFSTYKDNSLMLYSTLFLQSFLIYGYIMVSALVLSIKYYLFYKGKTFKPGSKWRDITNFNWHALKCTSLVMIIVFILATAFTILNYGPGFTIYLVAIILAMVLLAILWYFIDKKVGKLIIRFGLKILSVVILMWLSLGLSFNLLLTKFRDSLDVSSRNETLLNMYCSKDGFDYSDHSFFIQKTRIDCFGEGEGKLEVYEIKSPILKDAFKNMVINDFNIISYQDNTVFKHPVKEYEMDTIKNVFINDRYILLSDHELSPELLEYFSK